MNPQESVWNYLAVTERSGVQGKTLCVPSSPPLPGQLSLVSQPSLSQFFLDFQDKYLESLCSLDTLAFDAEGTGFWLEEASKDESQWRSRQLVSASPASPVLLGQE